MKGVDTKTGLALIICEVATIAGNVDDKMIWATTLVSYRSMLKMFKPCVRRDVMGVVLEAAIVKGGRLEKWK